MSQTISLHFCLIMVTLSENKGKNEKYSNQKFVLLFF